MSLKLDELDNNSKKTLIKSCILETVENHDEIVSGNTESCFGEIVDDYDNLKSKIELYNGKTITAIEYLLKEVYDNDIDIDFTEKYCKRYKGMESCISGIIRNLLNIYGNDSSEKLIIREFFNANKKFGINDYFNNIGNNGTILDTLVSSLSEYRYSSSNDLQELYKFIFKNIDNDDLKQNECEYKHNKIKCILSPIMNASTGYDRYLSTFKSNEIDEIIDELHNTNLVLDEYMQGYDGDDLLGVKLKDFASVTTAVTAYDEIFKSNQIASIKNIMDASSDDINSDYLKVVYLYHKLMEFDIQDHSHIMDMLLFNPKTSISSSSSRIPVVLDIIKDYRNKNEDDYNLNELKCYADKKQISCIQKLLMSDEDHRADLYKLENEILEKSKCINNNSDIVSCLDVAISKYIAKVEEQRDYIELMVLDKYYNTMLNSFDSDMLDVSQKRSLKNRKTRTAKKLDQYKKDYDFISNDYYGKYTDIPARFSDIAKKMGGRKLCSNKNGDMISCVNRVIDLITENTLNMWMYLNNDKITSGDIDILFSKLDSLHIGDGKIADGELSGHYLTERYCNDDNGRKIPCIQRLVDNISNIDKKDELKVVIGDILLDNISRFYDNFNEDFRINEEFTTRAGVVDNRSLPINNLVYMIYKLKDTPFENKFSKLLQNGYTSDELIGKLKQEYTINNEKFIPMHVLLKQSDMKDVAKLFTKGEHYGQALEYVSEIKCNMSDPKEKRLCADKICMNFTKDIAKENNPYKLRDPNSDYNKTFFGWVSNDDIYGTTNQYDPFNITGVYDIRVPTGKTIDDGVNERLQEYVIPLCEKINQIINNSDKIRVNNSDIIIKMTSEYSASDLIYSSPVFTINCKIFDDYKVHSTSLKITIDELINDSNIGLFINDDYTTYVINGNKIDRNIYIELIKQIIGNDESIFNKISRYINERPKLYIDKKLVITTKPYDFYRASACQKGYTSCFAPEKLFHFKSIPFYQLANAYLAYIADDEYSITWDARVWLIPVDGENRLSVLQKPYGYDTYTQYLGSIMNHMMKINNINTELFDDNIRINLRKNKNIREKVKEVGKTAFEKCLTKNKNCDDPQDYCERNLLDYTDPKDAVFAELSSYIDYDRRYNIWIDNNEPRRIYEDTNYNSSGLEMKDENGHYVSLDYVK